MLPTQNIFLERLYLENFSKITIYATAALKDRSKAQGISQDVFYEAVQHIKILMEHNNPGGWLMQTAKNKIHESERERMRYIHRFVSLDSVYFTAVFTLDEYEIEVHDPNEISLMNKIEQALSPEEYHLLKRIIFDNAPHMEIAKELGITVWASQKRWERVRKKLFEVFPERKRKNNF